jgi:hypothetical protein
MSPVRHVVVIPESTVEVVALDATHAAIMDADGTARVICATDCPHRAVN